MSNVIDKRVVSMEFDNARFEQNAKTSMSTIEKLKNSLNFNGIAKGLENVSKASNSFSLKAISDNIETLANRFSTLGIVGMRTIENLTDTAINYSKRAINFVKSGIISGGKARAMNLENANFQLQGLLKDEAKVAAVMENVGDAVDGTAYGLDAAAKVASQLAASGMEAGDSMFHALRGVAGVAAMTNSSYEDIGRIYTQVAGQGRLMGDQLLQLSGRGMNAAATLAEHFGKTEAEIRDMTSKGQISFEMFSEAMDSAFGEHAKKANETLTGALSNVKSALGRIGALFYSPLIKQNGSLVKLLNALREKINDIKTMVVPFAENVTDRVNKLAEGVTNLVSKVDIKKTFASKWSKLSDMMSDAGVSAETLQDRLTKTAKENGISIDDLVKKYGSFDKVMSSGAVSSDIIIKTIGNLSDTVNDSGKSLEYFNKMVKEVIIGNFGNGVDRVNALTEAGHNYADIQNLVNYIWERNGKTWSNCDLTLEEVTKTIDSLSDEQLQNIGYTKEQSDKLRQLASDAKDANTPVGELVRSLGEKSKGQLLIETFKNILEGIKGIANAAKDAISELYGTVKDSGGLGTVIEYFHDLSESFKMNDEKADKLKRTFKGLFAIFDMIRLVVGSGLNIVFKILKEVLHLFNIDILDCTANVGDAIVKFRDWLNSVIDVDAFIKGAAQTIKNIIDKIKEWYDILKLTGPFKDFIKWIEGTGSSISKWFDDLKKADNIPKYIIDGLINGLKTGIPKVIEFVGGLGTAIIDKIKEVLQIHSPSKAMESVGVYTVQGFAQGLQGSTSYVLDAIVSFGKNILDGVSQLNLGTIFAGGITTALTASIFKISKGIEAFGNLFNSVNSVLNSVSGLINQFSQSLKKLAKAAAFKMKMDGIKSLAIAIGILVACIIAISYVEDKTALWEAVAMVGVLAGILVALAWAVEKMGQSSVDIAKGQVQIKSVAGTIVAIAASMLVLAIAIGKLGTMKEDDLKQGLLGILAIVAILVAVLLGYKKIIKVMGEKDVEGAKILFAALAASIATLVAAVKILGTMSWEAIGKASVGIWEIVAVMAVLMIVSKMANAQNGVGQNLLMIAGSIGILAIVVKMLGGMKPEEIATGLVAVDHLAGVIIVLIAVVKLFKGAESKVGPTLLSIAGSIGILAIVCKILGTMSVESMIKGLAAIEVLVLIIAELMYIIKTFGGKSPEKLSLTLIGIASAMLILALVCVALGMFSIKTLAKGIVACGLLGIIIAVLIRSTANAKDCKGNLIVMAVVIVLMAAAIIALSYIDIKSLAASTLAMVALMGMFALMVKVADEGEKSLKTLMMMGLIMAGMALMLVALSNLDSKSVLSNAVALSTLMLATTGVLFILSKIGKKAKDALSGVLMLVALFVPLLLYTVVLNSMNGVQNGIANAIALSTLCLAMSVCVAILAVIGNFLTPGLAAGVIALAAMAVVLLGLVGILALMENLNSATENVNLLVNLMWNLTAMLVVLALVGPLALIGVTAMYALVGLMAVVAILATAIGALMEQCPQLESFLDTGLVILNKLAFGIGEMIGNFIAGFSEAVMKVIPELGTMLSQFAKNSMPFIMIMRTVDDQVLAGVGIMTGSIAALAVAEILSGIASLLTLGGSFAGLGLQLSAFAIAALPFILTMASIDPQAMLGAKYLAETMLILVAADLINGIASFFGQKTDLAEFGKQLVPFGRSIASFSKEVSGKVDGDAVQAAANAGKIMADFANTLPKTGGVIQDFFGETMDMSTFGKNMVDFGMYLSMFSLLVKNVDGDIVKNAADAGSAMAEMNKNLPATGGVLQDFLGETMDMSTFGKNLEDFGSSLAKFAESVKDIDTDAIKAAADAGTLMSNLNNSLPSTGGIIHDWFTGNQKLDEFGNNLGTFGSGISDFSDNITGVDSTTVKSAAEAGQILANIANSIPNSGGMGSWFGGGKSLKDFGDTLKPLGEGLKNYYGEIKELNFTTLETAATKTSGIATAVGNISSTDVDGVKDFTEALKNLKDGDISGFIENAKDYTSDAYTIGQDVMKQLNDGFTDCKNKITDTSKETMDNVVNEFKSRDDDFKVAGNNIALHTRNGINHSAGEPKTAMGTLADSLVNTTRDRYNNIYNAGTYLVTGLSTGITDNTNTATSSITTLMTKVIQTANKTAEIHSPSRVFAEIGGFIVSGLAKGINDNADESTMASKSMTKRIIDGARNAMSELFNVFDGIDTNPTITPIMDLSNVNRGISAIGSLMNKNNSFTINTNTEPVRSALTTKNQNGLIDNRKTTNAQITNNNTFNIPNATNPREVAYEVSTILKKQIERANL